MVPYLILLLGISLVGMVGLLVIKNYELTTGKMVFASVRPAISKFSARMVFLFGTAVPQYVKWEAYHLYRTGLAFVHRVTARLIVMLEHWLERVLTHVREKTAPNRAPGEASAFLREVGEYKKKLTESANNQIHQE